VRVDTGVAQGDSITPFYDPMIAKLIVHGADRAAALAKMKAALAAWRIVGVANNVEFLGRLVATPSFANAALDTALIEREQARLAPPAGDPPEGAWLLAAFAEAERALDAAAASARRAPDAGSPWRSLDAWRLNGRGWWRMGFRVGETLREVDVVARADAGWDFLVEGEQLQASGRRTPDGELEATIGGRRFTGAVVAQGEKRHVFLDGRSIVLTHADPLGVAGAEHEEEGTGLLSPMPGKVIALLAQPGAAVEKGAPLLVLEAMKMEHTISAPHAGTVKSFRFAAGDQVEEGVALVEFE